MSSERRSLDVVAKQEPRQSEQAAGRVRRGTPRGFLFQVLDDAVQERFLLFMHVVAKQELRLTM
jgi:hypothetical protein